MPNVRFKIEQADGTPHPRAYVRVVARGASPKDPVYKNGGSVRVGETVVHDDNADGEVMVTLDANSTLIPPSSYYEAFVPNGRKERKVLFRVSGSGTVDVEDLLIDTPGEVAPSALSAHVASVSNHDDVDTAGVAVGQVLMWNGTAWTPVDTIATDLEVASAIAAHSADTTNVHGIADTAQLITQGDARLTDPRTPTGPAGGVLSGTYPNPGFASDMATQAELDTHTARTDNPHAVTKAQVGLGAVDNTADNAKPVSSAQQSAIDGVQANIDAHLTDTVDAHDASAISFVPSGSIAATHVQGAIEEVAAEAGAGTAASEIAVRLTKTANQSIPASTETPVTWDSEVYDVGGMHTGSSAQVTIPSTGKYHVTCQVTFAINGTGLRRISLYQNSTEIANRDLGGEAAQESELVVTATPSCNSGDTLEIRVFQGELTATNIKAGVTESWFDVFRVGAGTAVPSLHAATHATGGSDPVTPASIGAADNTRPRYPWIGAGAAPRRSDVSVVDDFETITGWSFATPTADTVNRLSGSQGAKITSTDGATVNALRSVSLDVREQFLEVWAYVEDATKLQTLALGLHDTAGSGYLRNYSFVTGWNRLLFTFHSGESQDGTLIARSALAAQVNFVYFRVKAVAGQTTSVTFDGLRLVRSPLRRPVCLISFDDHYRSVFTKALPLLQERGIPATFFVNPNNVGGSNVTVAQLQVLRDLGWAIGSHTMAHIDMTSMTQTNLEKDLRDTQRWLLDNGFNPRALAYPFGSNNTSVRTAVKRFYEVARTVGSPAAPPLLDMNDLMLLPGEVLSSSGLAATLTKISDVAMMKGVYSSFLHAVGTGEYTGGTTEITEAEFEQALDAFVESGYEFLTFDGILDANRLSMREQTVRMGDGTPKPSFRSNIYYWANGTTTNHAPSLNEVLAVPFWVPRPTTFDRIGLEVTSAGAAGAIYRLGLYADDGNGYPGALQVEAGTIDATSTGFKELTISQALAPGLYWLAAVSQVATANARGVTGNIPSLGTETSGNSSVNIAALARTGQSGALPAAFGGSYTSRTTGFKVMLRAV